MSLSVFSKSNTLCIDKEFIKYYKSFIYESNKRGHKLPSDRLNVKIIKTSGLEHNIEAICYISENKIFINKRKWDTLKESMKERLIYHELGHCVLGLKHDNSLDESWYPKTIMHKNGDTYASKSYKYINKRDIFLDRLFNYKR
jgi:Zn-dependent peptidase ImmA (M78 family)